jgi:hypothetical protein
LTVPAAYRIFQSINHIDGVKDEANNNIPSVAAQQTTLESIGPCFAVQFNRFVMNFETFAPEKLTDKVALSPILCVQTPIIKTTNTWAGETIPGPILSEIGMVQLRKMCGLDPQTGLPSKPIPPSPFTITTSQNPFLDTTQSHQTPAQQVSSLGVAGLNVHGVGKDAMGLTMTVNVHVPPTTTPATNNTTTPTTTPTPTYTPLGVNTNSLLAKLSLLKSTTPLPDGDFAVTIDPECKLVKGGIRQAEAAAHS